MLKTNTNIVFFAIIAFCLWGIAPAVLAATGINDTITFQGKVVNTNGTNVADGSYDFEFKLYTVSGGGAAVWTETWNSGTSQVTVTDGIFQVALGAYTDLPGSVDFNTDNIYLGVNFNGDGEMDPRVRFAAVPQAFMADTLDGVDGLSFLRSDTSDSFTSGTLTFDAGTILDVNGDLAIADTAIVLDGASTEFTSTGNVTFNTDDFVITKSTSSISTAGDLTVSGGDITLNTAGTIIPSAAGTITIGSSNLTALTVTTDGTGTAEVALPAGSIDGTEILDDTITEPDLNAQGTLTDEFCLTYETGGGALLAWQSCGAASGNTLDQSYDQGGAGAGRAITADTGAVTITVLDASNNAALEVTQNDITNNPVGLQVQNAGTGNGLFIDQNGNGMALSIDGEETTADIVDISGAVLTQGNAIDIPDLDALTTGKGLNIASGSESITTGELATLALTSSGSANANKTGNLVSIASSRTDTRTSGTTADNYDLLGLTRTNVINGSGGTLTATGSVLRIENVATQTAGTLTDTVNGLEVVMDADGSGDAIFVDNNGTGKALEIQSATGNSVVDILSESESMLGLALAVRTNAAPSVSYWLLDVQVDANGTPRDIFTVDGAGGTWIDFTDDGSSEAALQVSANSLNNGDGVSVKSTSTAIGSANLAHIAEVANGSSLANRFGSTLLVASSRTETRTSGTTADNYEGILLQRINKINGSGGTLTATGSVLTVENVATQTAGTLTDTTVGIKVLMDADGSGDAIFVDSNGTSTTSQIALNIDSESTTADVIAVDGTLLTSGDGLQLSVDTDALSTGKALRVRGTSTGTTDVFTVDGQGNIIIASTSATTDITLQNGETIDNNTDDTIAFGATTISAASTTTFNCSDCIDFDDLEDTLDLDAAVTLNQATNAWTQNYTGTTADGYTYNANSLTSGDALAINSTSTALTSGELLNLDYTASGSSLANKTGNLASVDASRTETRTSGTTADDYDLFGLSRTSVQNGGGGTTTAAGSVLRLENIATQTAGTLTDTVKGIELVMDADGSGDAIFVDSNGTSTTSQIALNIDSESTTADVIALDGTLLTTGDGVQITVDNSMTTGKALRILGGASGTTEVFNVDDDGATTLGGDLTWTAGTPTITINSTETFTVSDGTDTFAVNHSGNLFSLTSGSNSFTFDADTGPSYAGNARPTKKVTLIPEFPGAALTGDGSSNTGTMTSDFCSKSNTNPPDINTGVCVTAADLHNYYTWTANATNDYDVWVNWQVPSDFSAFASSTAIQFYGWRSSTSDSVTVTVYDDNDAICGSATAISGTVATWNSTNYADPTGCSAIVAGDTITFRIQLSVGVNSEFARIGEIAVSYLAKF